MAEWNNTTSYTYPAYVTYNGYQYMYANKDGASTPGVPPNVETFNLTYKGETRNVRSWTLADYSTPAAPQTFLPGGHAEIRGLPGSLNKGSTGTKAQPRFEYIPRIAPYIALADNENDIGQIPPATFPYDPSQVLSRYFEPGVYVNDGAGFNAEYKEDYHNDDWSYNITDFIYAGGTQWPTGSIIRATIEHKVVKSSTSADLYVYAYPLKQSAVLQAPDQTNASFMALFNCFGKRFSFKYAVIKTLDNGEIDYQIKDGVVSTGEFHDNFSEDNLSHGVKVETFFTPGVVDINYEFSTNPEIGFTQEIKMLDLYEDQ